MPRGRARCPNALAGRVGDDAGGRLLLAHLAAHGVRAHVGIDEDAPTGTVLVVDGEIRADRGANARYAPEHLPRLVGEAVLVSGHLPEATAAAALARADAPWVALDAARLGELPGGAPVVLANEAAARRLTGAGAEEAARRLASGRRLACVALAGAGALAARDGQVHRAAAPAAAGTKDDVPGAGDAFAATLLCELARGAGVPEALARACDAGAGVARTTQAPQRQSGRGRTRSWASRRNGHLGRAGAPEAGGRGAAAGRRTLHGRPRPGASRRPARPSCGRCWPARIVRLDASAALDFPGVIGVLTGADVAAMSRPFPVGVDGARPTTPPPPRRPATRASRWRSSSRATATSPRMRSS